jgi:type I pantothenate kinase
VTEAPAVLAQLAQARARGDGTPIVVGLAGAVASGKSTLAAELADAATKAGADTAVVTTDGFLYPNVELTERGLVAHKGFPETYDVAALQRFVYAIHSGVTELMVPRYSHETYDVGTPEPLSLTDDAIVVIEGVNALGALHEQLDLGIYVHAEESDLERWYVDRFLVLCSEAADDPASFYRRFVGMSASEIEDLARGTWRSINLVNLREHIAPTRELADCVVVKGPDHTVTEVEMRDDRRPCTKGGSG